MNKVTFTMGRHLPGQSSVQKVSFFYAMTDNKTQEQIAISINKNKMLISGMESGKNNPPIGEDLKKVILALGLDENEKREFEIVAAMERNTLPDQIIELIKRDDRIIKLLYEIDNNELTNDKYKKMIKLLK